MAEWVAADIINQDILQISVQRQVKSLSLHFYYIYKSGLVRMIMLKTYARKVQL